jgi:hypothetical protein
LGVVPAPGWRCQVKLRNAFRQAEAALQEARNLVQEQREGERIAERKLAELATVHEELKTLAKRLAVLKTEIDSART